LCLSSVIRTEPQPRGGRTCRFAAPFCAPQSHAFSVLGLYVARSLATRLLLRSSPQSCKCPAPPRVGVALSRYARSSRPSLGRVVCDKMRPRRRRGWCVGHTSVLGGHDGPVSDVESVDDSCLLCVQATCPGRRVVSQSVFQTNWQKRIGRRESGAVEGWPSQARALPATTRSGRA